jgi:hypothetical protein
VVSLRRERRPAGGGITTGVYRGIGDGLQVLVHDDAALLALDVRPVQIEIVELRHTPRAVDDHVRFETALRSTLQTTDGQTVRATIDGSNFGLQLHANSEVACAAHEQIYQIRIKALESSSAPVQDRDVRARRA